MNLPALSVVYGVSLVRLFRLAGESKLPLEAALRELSLAAGAPLLSQQQAELVIDCARAELAKLLGQRRTYTVHHLESGEIGTVQLNFFTEQNGFSEVDALSVLALDNWHSCQLYELDLPCWDVERIS